jgi:predicted dehydrogenase
MINYRMNAGYLPMDHWVHGPEGGGRNLGEACHIYDLFTYLSGARVSRVDAQALAPTSSHYGRSDNFTVTLGFEDGSVASLTYTALGFSGYPKETAELYFDGKVVSLGDYRSLDVHGGGRGLKTSAQEKGLREELAAFGDAVLKGGEWPIPWWQQLQVARIGLAVESRILPRNGSDSADAASA